VGITHDGLFYLDAAHAFARGQGLSWVGSGGQLKPLVHFPPFYPLLIGLLVRLGISPAEAARWVSAALFGLNASLLGTCVYWATRRLWMGLVASLIWLASPVLLSAHLAAMSEPLYLALMIFGLISAASSIVRPSRPTLVLSAIAVSLAWLTRWVGASLVVAFAIALLTLSRAPLHSRLRSAGIFLAIASVPMAIWLARNVALTGSPTNRTLGYHPPTVDTLRQFLDVLTRWVTTTHLSHWIEAGVLVGAAAMLSAVSIHKLASGKDGRPQAPSLSLLALIALAGYVLFLAASLTFFDASTRIDDRILSPILPLALIAALGALDTLLPRDRRSLLAAPLVLAGLWATLPNAWASSSQLLRSMREEGAGFSSRAWQQSETVAWIRALPAGAIVYTDEPAAVRYIASRETRATPQRYDPVTLIPRPDYAEQLETMRSDLRSPGSALVVFISGSLPDESAPMEELTAGLLLLATTSDAQIFVHPENPEEPHLP
jgi:hypothetical protein